MTRDSGHFNQQDSLLQDSNLNKKIIFTVSTLFTCENGYINFLLATGHLCNLEQFYQYKYLRKRDMQ